MPMFTVRRWLAALAGLALAAGLGLGLFGCQEHAACPAPACGGYLLCFWNVENLFDDCDDARTFSADTPYDDWFSRDAAALQLKLSRLGDALLALNDGRGPDILVLAEVESVRAAELLQQALNHRLDAAQHYRYLLMKEVSAGRHIAPAILTRVPALADRTQLLGKRQRILEGHLRVDGHELVLIAAHWTSRLSDRSGRRRCDYADQIFGRYHAMYRSNPAVDLIVCGDFNDPPEAKSVTDHLHATGDLEAVRQSGGVPRLFNLFAQKDPADFGSHYYRHWHIFDQIVVSPGLLDEAGWSCRPETARTARLPALCDSKQRPWRFGDAQDRGPRGYSDHFPVTVRLQVPAAEPAVP